MGLGLGCIRPHTATHHTLSITVTVSLSTQKFEVGSKVKVQVFSKFEILDSEVLNLDE